MARTAEDIVREMLGGQALAIANLTAQLEAVRLELTTLKEAQAEHKLTAKELRPKAVNE